MEENEHDWQKKKKHRWLYFTPKRVQEQASRTETKSQKIVYKNIVQEYCWFSIIEKKYRYSKMEVNNEEYKMELKTDAIQHIEKQS